MKKYQEGGYEGEGGCYGGIILFYFSSNTLTMYASPPFPSYYHERNAPSVRSERTAETNGRDEG